MAPSPECFELPDCGVGTCDPSAGNGAAAAVTFLTRNRDLYALLARRTGAKGAACGMGLHAVHHLTGTAALLAGLLVHVRGQLLGRESRPK